MRYRGTLYVENDAGPGLPVELVIDGQVLTLSADQELIGSYPMRQVAVERLSGDRFRLTLAGEAVVFTTEDALSFSYEAVPVIRREGSEASLGSQVRHALRTFLGARDEGNGASPADPAPPPPPAPPEGLLPPPIGGEAAAIESPPPAPRLHPGALDPVEEAAEATPVGVSLSEAVRLVAESAPPAASPWRGPEGVLPPMPPLEEPTTLPVTAPDPPPAPAESPPPVSPSESLAHRLHAAVAEVQEGRLDPQAALAMAALAQAWKQLSATDT